MANALRIPIPPRLGGGDVVMREISVGDYEDALRASSDGIEATANTVMASIVKFRGKPLPVGAEREAWWRANSVSLRNLLIEYHSRIHALKEEDKAGFFEAAEKE